MDIPVRQDLSSRARRWLWALCGVCVIVLGVFAPRAAHAQQVCADTDSFQYYMRCDYGADTIGAHSLGYQTFIVKNTSSFPVGVLVTENCTYMSCKINCRTMSTNCWWNSGHSDSLVINAHDSVRVLVKYTTWHNVGPLVMPITFDLSNGLFSHTLERVIRLVNKTSYTVGGDLAPYQTAGTKPFAVSYAHSTAPYITLDAPRSFSLVYNSDNASPCL